MVRYRVVAAIFCGIAILGAGVGSPLHAADNKKPKSGVVSGIVTDKGDNFITVRPDGADEPVKYVYGDKMDAKSQEALKKTIFVVGGRVRLNFKMDGETPKLVSIEKLVGQQTGVVYGEVLFTHGWWLELKPKNGPPEGYAATYPKEKWQQTEAQIKTLAKGDIVGIKFVTDGERHRIVTLEKKPAK